MVETLFQSKKNTSQYRHNLKVGNRLWLWMGLGVVVLILIDQISRWWASQAGLVSLNQGVAFGIGLPPVVLIALTLVLLIGVGWGWWQVVKHNRDGKILTKNQLVQLISYSMILAGGISNLIDRLIWGGVRDWLPIPLTPLHNNLADWLIVTGCVGLIISFTRHHELGYFCRHCGLDPQSQKL